ncbi:MAG: hypothetical protein KC586_12700, partial [Myxococcales bacterium]|nr:hypothetical protein [Myxococcales bacterium]
MLGLLLGVLSGCDCDGPVMPECETSDECPGGACIDGRCVATDGGGMDAASDDAGPGVDGGAGEVCDSGVTCLGACCAGNERCAFDRCVIDLGPCSTNDDCAGDSYCDADGRCTPYGVPEGVVTDPDCERTITIGDFAPDEQCRWTGPASDDPYPTWNQVYSAPHVADLDLDGDPTVLAPSIIVSAFDSSADGGILRAIDGRTCEEQFALTDPADRLVYASNFAIGDLDGDGRPEIVGASLQARQSAGGLVAFGYDAASGTYARRWYGRQCDVTGEPRHIPNDWTNNNGPSMHDLDDDGVPEVIWDRFVYDSGGCVLNPGASYTNYLRLGLFSVIADVDADDAPELVRPDGVYRWTGSDWEREAYWAPTDVANAERLGHVAVADFGDFEGSTPGHAEIVVASAPSSSSPATDNGTVRVMTLEGRIVFGPIALPADGGFAGRGGPPTVGDFDGDGRREVAVAGGSFYTVFDLDCDVDAETAPGCTRVAGLPRGVLWSRPSQDRSSNVTGSSVF